MGGGFLATAGGTLLLTPSISGSSSRAYTGSPGDSSVDRYPDLAPDPGLVPVPGFGLGKTAGLLLKSAPVGLGVFFAVLSLKPVLAYPIVDESSWGMGDKRRFIGGVYGFGLSFPLEGDLSWAFVDFGFGLVGGAGGSGLFIGLVAVEKVWPCTMNESPEDWSELVSDGTSCDRSCDL